MSLSSHLAGNLDLWLVVQLCPPLASLFKQVQSADILTENGTVQAVAALWYIITNKQTVLGFSLRTVPLQSLKQSPSLRASFPQQAHPVFSLTQPSLRMVKIICLKTTSSCDLSPCI